MSLDAQVDLTNHDSFALYIYNETSASAAENIISTFLDEDLEWDK